MPPASAVVRGCCQTYAAQTDAHRRLQRQTQPLPASSYEHRFPLGRKSRRLCWAGLLWIRRLDPIAEAAQLPDHFRRAPLLGLFGNRRASFFVTDSLVQDQPDQPTLSMGNGSDGLIVSQARDGAAIYDFEDASFGPGCGVRSLIE